MPRTLHSRRLLAAGGIVGPCCFVAAWSILGATADGYTPAQDAISRLAAVGAPSQGAMTAGFIAFGVGVPAYAVALRDELTGRAWVSAVATGLATLGVAAAPLDRSAAGDLVHGAFASVGYATLAAVPWLAARSLAQCGEHTSATVSRAAGLASAAALAGTVFGPYHGLLQRVGLTIGDAWIVASAVRILVRRTQVS